MDLDPSMDLMNSIFAGSIIKRPAADGKSIIEKRMSYQKMQDMEEKYDESNRLYGFWEVVAMTILGAVFGSILTILAYQFAL